MELLIASGTTSEADLRVTITPAGPVTREGSYLIATVALDVINTGGMAAGPFKVDVFANGILQGQPAVAGLGPGQSSVLRQIVRLSEG